MRRRLDNLFIVMFVLTWLALLAVVFVEALFTQPQTRWRAVTDQEWSMVLEHRR